MSYDNNSYEATLGPSESFRKVPWYFANPPPEIPESTDLYLNSTLSTQVDLNSSLRSQRLEQSIRSIEEPFTVIRQIRMSQSSQIEPEIFSEVSFMHIILFFRFSCL